MCHCHCHVIVSLFVEAELEDGTDVVFKIPWFQWTSAPVRTAVGLSTAGQAEVHSCFDGTWFLSFIVDGMSRGVKSICTRRNSSGARRASGRIRRVFGVLVHCCV